MRNLVLSMLSKTFKSLMSLAMLLCSFSLLLSSCDKGVPEINPGDPVAISFSLNADAFGENEDLTRAAEAVAPETVVVPVEGGWYMCATLEPDASATRATSGGADPLATGTEVRILAYLNGGTTVTAQADYVVNGSSLNPKTSPLSVPAGNNYTFVAYACNNTTLPGTLTTLDPAATDLRWGETASIAVSSGTTVNINIERLYSKVTARITNVEESTSYTMLTPTGSSMDGYTVNLTNGKPVNNVSAITVPLTGWAGSGTPSNSVQTSGDCLVYTADGNAKMNLTNININGTPISDRTVTFDNPLKKNWTYTLRVVFMKNSSGGGTPISFRTYVGAFWRADETGERIIRIEGVSDAGDWTATVVEMDARWDAAGGDGIILEKVTPGRITLASSDIGGDPEDYQVGGSATSISGSVDAGGTILFRIGLQKTGVTKATYTKSDKWDYTNTPTYSGKSFPARYAVVVVTHIKTSDHAITQQKIFLRQGEGDDYVMRNSDPFGPTTDANAPATRTECVRFSPYNLTYSKSAWSPSGTGANAIDHPKFAAIRQGVFVDYPTQAGAYFHWSVGAAQQATYALRAYHPSIPALGSLTGWNTTYDFNGYWTSATDRHDIVSEICPNTPVVYRRVNDGSTSVSVPNDTYNIQDSEIRQSLWLNPQEAGNSDIANTVFGYYADGFFDRRQIGNSVGTSPGTASSVSIGNSEIAHIGVVVFNLWSSASLYFPAAGARTWQNGSLDNVGKTGAYWTSSASESAFALLLWHSFHYMLSAMDAVYRLNALPIRCVRQDAPPELIDGIISDPWGTSDTDQKDQWVNW